MSAFLVEELFQMTNSKVKSKITDFKKTKEKFSRTRPTFIAKIRTEARTMDNQRENHTHTNYQAEADSLSIQFTNELGFYFLNRERLGTVVCAGERAYFATQVPDDHLAEQIS